MTPEHSADDIQMPAESAFRPADNTNAGFIPQTAPPRRTPLLFLSLALTSVAVIVWLVRSEPPSVLPEQTQPAAADADSAPPGAILRRSSPQELAAQRRQSQSALAAALEPVDLLRARDGENWARSALHAIKTEIAAGEKAYREMRYRDADQHYAAASERARQELERLPAVATELVEEGQLGLAAGNSAAARSAFQRALRLLPDDARTLAGLARAESLDHVAALIAQAQGYEQLQQHEKAAATYREALTLDADAPAAASALARIELEQRAKVLDEAMSAGFAALQSQRFDAASAAFQRAQALDASRPDIPAALAQVARARAAWTLETQVEAARRAAAAEQWEEAVTRYDRALALDAAMSDVAREREDAATRLSLDRELIRLLSRPGDYVQAPHRAETEAYLAAVRARGLRGERLQRQLRALERVLKLAGTPLRVVLRSDGRLRVSIVPTDQTLDPFQERALSLLPGPYTATGTGDDCAEVRVEFQLSHDHEPAAIEIRCPAPNAQENDPS